ncbi:hypothetical protein TRICHSKD4_1674 [Roseibium sp. TrichSKD4]|uniref:DUF6732 family protein n=1 Tax=Roseibium sp. TrichSKD4 TaxID=744980 RepID=UPI0001E563B9|nr:DUF6732 family protein [Roseibium sp. TrichSKD4]EFO33051.1 hypothetical protein TRICHSKD4_1674 [Roseibium sp. TrichSKD4]
MRPSIGLAVSAAALLASSPAFAHAGHIGELAGHSHWIAMGALAGAAAIAAVVAARGYKKTPSLTKKGTLKPTTQKQRPPNE